MKVENIYILNVTDEFNVAVRFKDKEVEGWLFKNGVPIAEKVASIRRPTIDELALYEEVYDKELETYDNYFNAIQKEIDKKDAIKNYTNNYCK